MQLRAQLVFSGKRSLPSTSSNLFRDDTCGLCCERDFFGQSIHENLQNDNNYAANLHFESTYRSIFLACLTQRLGLLFSKCHRIALKELVNRKWLAPFPLALVRRSQNI